MHTLKNILNDFSHLFFPQVCAGCGTDILSADALLCMYCFYQLPVTNFHLYANNPVEQIFYGRLPVKNASSYCYFTKNSLIQRVIFQIKYKGNKELGYFAGKLMGESLMQNNRFDNIDGIVPLPLFAAREKRRGYNQAAVLCDGISALTGIPVLKNAVTRVRHTETQTHKNRIERWYNMEGRFELQDAEAISNKHILLVDDVITTGATLEACGSTLLKIKNTRLSILTLAYSVK